MLRFLFRLFVGYLLFATVFWVGFLTWVENTPEEKREAQLKRLFTLPGSAPIEPLPPIKTMRAETRARMAEIDGLYNELVATHRSIEETLTDRWEKKDARDDVTLAEIARRHFLRNTKYDRESDEIGKVAKAWRAVALERDRVEGDLGRAREKLASLRGGPSSVTE